MWSHRISDSPRLWICCLSPTSIGTASVACDRCAVIERCPSQSEPIDWDSEPNVRRYDVTNPGSGRQ